MLDFFDPLSPFSHLCISPFFLILSLTSFIIRQALAPSPLYLFLHHLPLSCLLPIPLCTFQSTSLSSSLSPSLSSEYVFALAQLSAACSSCTHT